MRFEELGSDVLMFVGDDHESVATARRVDDLYREPQVLFDSTMTLRWGAHQLCFLHNPGKTMDHVSVEVPTADLICAGDNVVGNIVYLSKADPMLMRGAIGRMRQLGRREAVIRIRLDASPGEVDEHIASIQIEACVAAQVEPAAFERDWHQHNLEVIVAQSTFALDTSIASRAERV